MARMQSEPFTPTSSARPESELVKGWKQLEADANLAETQLVSANFLSAASTAEALLQRTLYVPDSTSFEVRAAFVSLQALYELDRFAEAEDLLVHHYGKVAQSEPEVMFLWVSLAIDTKERDAAAAALRSYLASVVLKDSTSRKLPLRTPKKGQTAPVQLSKAQYMAGAQLYALEVLAKGLDEASQAARWIQQDANLLEESQKEELLRELASLAPQSSALPSKEQRRMPKAAAPISKKVSTTADSYKTQQPLKQPWQSNNLSNAVTSEIQPAENQPSSLGSPSAADSSHSDVQAQHKRQLFGSSQESSSWMSDAASGLTGKAHALWSGKAIQLGGTDVTAGQVLGAAALTGLLAFAAFAERKALKRLAKKSASWLQHSIMDASTAALNLTPNPMTARGTAYTR